MQLLSSLIRSTNHLWTSTIRLVFLSTCQRRLIVDHTILLKKLAVYGITGANVAWFRSYLTNRKQYICTNDNTKTNEQKVTCGVPQGSILRRLLFSIYLNDLPSASNLLNTIMFADDTSIYCEHGDRSILLSAVNRCRILINGLFQKSSL